MGNDRPLIADPPVRLRLLGPMMISRDGTALPLPASRKARALLAFLAVSPAPVSRSHLCELLWDLPNDPRSELRWCLSKIRRILDQPGRRRVGTGSDAIQLDLSDCFVDALEVARAASGVIENLDAERLRAISELFAGEFLEGLDLYRSPEFNAWIIAERRRFHGRHLAVLEQLARRTDGDAVFGYLESWMQLAPFDPRVHEMLLTELARRGRRGDAEEHLAATARVFKAEGLDPRPIRRLWRTAWAKESAAAQAGYVPLAAPTRAGSAESGAAGSSDPDTDYVVTGSVRRYEKRLTVAVELVETRADRVVWAEVFHHILGDALLSLEEIGNRIVTSIANAIERPVEYSRTRSITRAGLRARFSPTNRESTMANKHGEFIWYELMTRDPDAAKAFYDEVVGWNIGEPAPGPLDYRPISAGADMVGGVLRLTDEMRAQGARPVWLGYVGVDDVDATAGKVRDLGGTVLMPARDIPGAGRIAMVADPDGTPFYIMRGAVEDGTSTAFQPKANGHCSWNELTTPDQAGALSFYGQLFGWENKESMPMGEAGDYQLLEHNGVQFGALSPFMNKGQQPIWTYYFRVPDIDAALAKTEARGGKILHGPHEVPGGDYIIIGRDPEDTLFALTGPGANRETG